MAAVKAEDSWGLVIAGINFLPSLAAQAEPLAERSLFSLSSHCREAMLGGDCSGQIIRATIYWRR